MSRRPPALPQAVIDTILSHLIPPTIPLPRHLVAQPLLHRLEFVPPEIHDTDAFLTPNPQPASLDGSASLTSRLGSLVDGYAADQVAYAFDGETVFARLPLRPAKDRSSGPVVLVVFAYENGLRARGWVYHAAEVPGHDVLSWSDSVPSLPASEQDQSNPTVLQPDDADQADLTAPHGYWEGFTPSTSHIDLTRATEKTDDDYWASYGQAVGTASPHLDVNDGPTRPKTPRLSGPGPPIDVSHHGDASAADIRDKIESKIMVMLRSLWAAWVKGVERQDEMEERALSWLRTCREALDGGTDSLETTASSTKDVVLSAKLQILKELFETLNPAQDGFWRRVEEVVRMPMGSLEGTEESRGW